MITPYRKQAWQSKHKPKGKPMVIRSKGPRRVLCHGTSPDRESKVIVFFASNML